MFWKSKEEREQERIQREKDDESMRVYRANEQKREQQEKQLLEDLINVPSSVWLYVTVAFSEEAAESGRAFTEGAGEVFYTDMLAFVLAFARAEGEISSSNAQLLLNIGAGEFRQGERISPDMYRLQQRMKGSAATIRDLANLMNEQYSSLLQGDEELVVVPRTVRALEIYDEEHGTAYAAETVKVFLRLVAKLAKRGSKAHLFVEGKYKELLERVGDSRRFEDICDSIDSSRAELDSIIAATQDSECQECDDAYRLLEVEKGANAASVKDAYRDMAMVWHPDRFGDDSRLKTKAQEQFKKINDAYAHLREHQASPHLVHAEPTPHHSQPKPDDLAGTVRVILKTNKTDAIKFVRERTGLGLKEAKDYVDSLL